MDVTAKITNVILATLIAMAIVAIISIPFFLQSIKEAIQSGELVKITVSSELKGEK